MHRKQAKHSYRRFMALLLTLCLVLSSVNSRLLISYASADKTEYQIGSDITAVLHDDGLLTLSGSGDTFDYGNDDSSWPPFYAQRESITRVEISEGITSIGDYLFYNCENLTGTLVIPQSVIRIGDYAFSGDSVDSAPSFRYIYNEFVETEIVAEEEQPESAPSPEAPTSAGSEVKPDASEAPDSGKLPAEEESPADEITAEPDSPAENTPVDESAPSVAEEPVGDGNSSSDDDAPVGDANSSSDDDAPVGDGNSSSDDDVPVDEQPAPDASDAALMSYSYAEPQYMFALSYTSMTEISEGTVPLTNDFQEAASLTDEPAGEEPENSAGTEANPVEDETDAASGNDEDAAPPVDTEHPVSEDPAAPADEPADEEPESSADDPTGEEPESSDGAETNPIEDETDTPNGEPESPSGNDEDALPPVDAEQPVSEDPTAPADDASVVPDQPTQPEQANGSAGGSKTPPSNIHGITSNTPASEPSYELTYITEQEVGEEIFFPDQLGVFELSEEENESFRVMALNAGYAEVLGYASISFSDGDSSTVTVSVPLTQQGIFLPDYSATGLVWPDESHNSYAFTGWTEAAAYITDDNNAAAEPIESEDIIPELFDTGTGAAEDTQPDDENAAAVFPAYSFYSGDASEFSAGFSMATRTMKKQTIFTDVGGQRVSVSGNLPVGAAVSADFVPVETAAQLAGDYIPDASMVVLALDITVLVDGIKYQPNEYGESVSVSITGVDAAPAGDQSLAVLHIDESAAMPEETVQVIETDSVTNDAVAFTADSFSVYIITMAENHTLTFHSGAYTLQDTNGNDLVDETSETLNTIDITTTGAFFKFKIVPTTGNVVTDVTSVPTATGDPAMVYGPTSGIYTVSKVMADQTVTVTLGEDKFVTYNANGGTGYGKLRIM